ncbi:MAG: TonB-dependent receptor [Deltaproteobacteria bacterium]|nr:TonB-dependent receptor [Deltaproteobacteria bacterium]
MNARKLLIAALTGAGALVGTHLVHPTSARAQSATSGAVQGVVADAASGEPLPGVTVIVTSPAIAQTQTAITDEKGFYKITELPPGEYLVTFYYADITLERSGIYIGVNKTVSVSQKLDQSKAGGETIHVKATAPTIDPTSTTQGITIDKNYMKNIPVPGRTFESTLGAAAGSQSDGVGVSFSGSSSLENQYYVDGVNTTGLTFGTVGSPVINDFIEEIEVITGGYNAEFGRATGGVVNVVTKSGSNEFKGSVFGYFQPGALTAAAKTTPINAGSIDAKGDIAYNADFGFELGGPIIKDKAWFFVGFAPAFSQVDYTRYTKSQTDCHKVMADGTLSTCDPANRDGIPDIDPKTGFYITDLLDTEVRSSSGHTYNALGKINYAVTPEHQGQISVQAQPSAGRNPGLFGPAVNGYQYTDLTTDVSAKWTSKFNDNKTEVEAVVGWHRDNVQTDALDPTLENVPLQVLLDGDLGHWGHLGQMGDSESSTTMAGCTDGPIGSSDKYPLIVNCPMSSRSYVIGGPGSINRDTEQRRSAKLSLTQRVKAAGSHEIKAGIDGEDNLSDKARLYSGGAFIENFVGPGQVYVNRWVQLTDQNNTDPRFDNTCRTPDPNASGPNAKPMSYKCDYLGGTPGSPGTQIQGETLNWAAYVRDSWQIQPNLTLNVGLRYEEQRLRYAEFLRNTIDPLTGVKLGTNAMSLTNMWAPRVGLLYDWTKEGRSKVYAHWGRFYESIPMDINDRSFGGEVTYRQIFTASQCGMTDPKIGGPNGVGCANSNAQAGLAENLIGASGVYVEPGIAPQYMDEIITGMEYEILDDLKIGVSYQNRRLGRVIEDFSTDGAQTYIIGNPGEFSTDEEKALQDRINRTDDPIAKGKLQNQLKLFQGSRIFDKPRRDYNALQFTLTRRFSKALYVQGSYTYSRTEGNYPGLVSYDNGQVDPNISSQYDLIELLANHIGPLPTDRPHYIKLDGYYTFDLKKAGSLTTGIRFRALSGIPENALAAHYLYGPDESFLLPRGELGRTDFDHGLDLHVGYGRNIGKGMTLEFFVDIYNVYNRQGTAGVDNTYAPPVKLAAGGVGGEVQNANPVSGGTYEDLIWVKELDKNGGETSTPIGRNPNFHNTNSRYAPAYGRLGLRLTF